MAKTLADVLAAEDDLVVCNDLYALLLTRYGKLLDPALLPVEHRTVFSVWHTSMMIGNGGFNGFFKAEMLADPDYTHMLAAYKAIGCEPALAALNRVFDAFPDRVPSEDPDERLRDFVDKDNAVEGALDRDFLKTADALTAAVATYIREHAAALADVEKPGTGYAIAVPQRSVAAPVAVPVTSKADVVASGLPRLPRWARAAFYAHCAHLVFSDWDEAWPESPPMYREGIEQAIILAELCAAEGREVGDLRAASRQAICAAEAAAATNAAGRMGGPPPADPAAATNIAISAAIALDFIAGDEEADFGFAKAAIDASGRVDLMEQVQGDFQKLKKLAREGGWTEKTPVPPEVFRSDFDARGKSWWKRW